MLCAHCRARRWRPDVEGGDPGVGPTGETYLCGHCGALLIARPQPDRLLDYLGRLWALGLAMDAPLLLEPGSRRRSA